MPKSYTYKKTYYQPTAHFEERYIERMSKVAKSQPAKNRLLRATSTELAKRANYMLLFSIHGKPGETEQTEVRYYFEWDIVVDNKNRTLVTMYINEERNVPPVRLFGDRKVRKMIYDLWFRPKSKIRQHVNELIV